MNCTAHGGNCKKRLCVCEVDMIGEVKGEARRLWLAGCKEKLGASPSLPVNSHSIEITDQESRLMIDQAIAMGRGGVFLRLTEEQ